MHEFPRFNLVDWIDADLLPQGVKVGFTSRDGGTSAGDQATFNLAFHVGDDPDDVRANRDLLHQDIGTDLVWMIQVHGDRVAHAHNAQPGSHDYLSVGEADAVVVESGQAAAVMVADCIPLILVCKDGTRGAAVHVGRAGFDLAIADRVLDEFDTEVSAFFGPSICGKCYEVSPELAMDVNSRWPGAAVTTRWGTTGLDVAGGLERQLRDRGVTDIHRSPICSYESPNYYSHRRATRKNEKRKTGRFIGFVQIK